jgi:hypothetical protein
MLQWDNPDRRDRTEEGKLKRAQFTNRKTIKLQNWNVIKIDDEGRRNKIGEILTGTNATYLQAYEKALYKFNGGKHYIIGWCMELTKKEIKEH